MTKKKLATIWLDGCSGCHMSLLDMDQSIVSLAESVELVYGPLVDTKEIPADIDIALVEGSVSTEDDLKKVKKLRSQAKFLVAFGDCAVTANVPGMRNSFGPEAIMQRAYIENANLNPLIPDQVIPKLLPQAKPVNEVIEVDLFVPGCPPPSDVIYYVVSELVQGRIPDITDRTRFGM